MMRKLIAVVIASVVMALGLATQSVSATAQPVTKTTMVAAATFNACSVPLNPDRRSVYKFKRGTSTLSFGQVVVTATRDYYHRYCVQYQTGGRNLWTSWNLADAPYNGGCGSYIGRMGSSGSWSTGSSSTLTVPDKTCIKDTYGIKSGGLWYYASFVRYNA
jgi:hypothetical protein